MKEKKYKKKNTSQTNEQKKSDRKRAGFYTEEGYKRLKMGGRKGGQTTKLIRDKFKPRNRNVCSWVDEDIPAKWRAWKASHSLFERWEAMDRELMKSIERVKKSKAKEAK